KRLFSIRALGGLLLTTSLCLLFRYSLGTRVALHWLPDIAHVLEEHIEQRLSVELEVRHIKGEMKGFFPVISLKKLKLIPTDKGVSPFAIDTEQITINPWRSQWRKRLQLQQLTLSGASLHLVVDKQEAVRLRGQGVNIQRTDD